VTGHGVLENETHHHPLSCGIAEASVGRYEAQVVVERPKALPLLFRT
jgi:hypothetical protein